MKEKVLITGFTGNVAKTLAKTLDDSTYRITFLTSNPKHCSKNIQLSLSSLKALNRNKSLKCEKLHRSKKSYLNK